MNNVDNLPPLPEFDDSAAFNAPAVRKMLRDYALAALAAQPEREAARLLREALQEIVSAADGGGWQQLDPSLSKARAALATPPAQVKAEGVRCTYTCEAFPECGCVPDEIQQAIAALQHVLDCLLRDSLDEIQASQLDRAVSTLLSTAQARPSDANVRDAEPNIEAAAQKLADVMDYPWEHMPTAGRVKMRENAWAVIKAAKPPSELATDADVRDAGRYRWLRERLKVMEARSLGGSYRDSIYVRVGQCFFDTPTRGAKGYTDENRFEAECKAFDAAIDAAMQAATPPAAQGKTEGA